MLNDLGCVTSNPGNTDLLHCLESIVRLCQARLDYDVDPY